MCDHAGRHDGGWRGWIELPPARPLVSAADWLDLSHPLGPDMPVASVFARPQFRRLKAIPADPLNVTEMCMAVHSGTHVDAPFHFFADAPAFDAIPLERLIGEGVVLDIPGEPCLAIDAAMLEERGAGVRPGDIVALHTGWADHAGTPLYERHPWLTASAAEWLVARRVKLLACDFASADLPIVERQPGFDWPAHRILLAHGILICEHLTGHRALAGQRAEFVFNALNIQDSDGAPARVLARAAAQ